MDSIETLKKISFIEPSQPRKDTVFHKKCEQVFIELFGKDKTDGEKEKLLKSPLKYQLIGVNAKFGSVNLRGLIGHHLTLVARIEGMSRPIIIEMDGPKEGEIEDENDPMSSQLKG